MALSVLDHAEHGGPDNYRQRSAPPERLDWPESRQWRGTYLGDVREVLIDEVVGGIIELEAHRGGVLGIGCLRTRSRATPPTLPERAPVRGPRSAG
jgi:hypothetical protein